MWGTEETLQSDLNLIVAEGNIHHHGYTALSKIRRIPSALSLVLSESLEVGR